jgi:hypothetical protein
MSARSLTYLYLAAGRGSVVVFFRLSITPSMLEMTLDDL